jgi:hypothetical protein
MHCGLPGKETMSDLLEKLKGGDRSSIGGTNEVVANVLNDATLFQVVFTRGKQGLSCNSTPPNGENT